MPLPKNAIVVVLPDQLPKYECHVEREMVQCDLPVEATCYCHGNAFAFASLLEDRIVCCPSRHATTTTVKVPFTMTHRVKKTAKRSKKERHFVFRVRHCDKSVDIH